MSKISPRRRLFESRARGLFDSQMPVYTVPTKSHTDSNRSGELLTSQISENESADLPSQSQSKTKGLNRTYVVSACNKLGDSSSVLVSGGKLTLQRRTAISKEKPDENTLRDRGNTQTERQQTLQRRLRTGSTETHKTNDVGDSRGENARSVAQKSRQTLFPEKAGATFVQPGLQSFKGHTEVKRNPNLKNGSFLTYNSSSGTGNCTPVRQRALISASQSKNEIPQSTLLMTAESENRSLSKLAEKVDFQKESGTESGPNKWITNEHLGKEKIQWKRTKLVPKCGSIQDAKSPAASTVKNRTTSLQAASSKKTSASNSFSPSIKKGKGQENTVCTQTALLKEDTRIRNVCTGGDPLKTENSKVTVAVRIRPFSSRDKSEETFHLVSMIEQETVVHHPDTKQIYSFIFDFSFWSFDKSHHNFASQETVYRSLAAPLLERAFEGYNTCLFAYGQTGSGKSYTMMGFDDEERGIIPRFCEDLFTRIAETEKQKTYHLEMSYFEIYNEKIHDLLVLKAENRQKKQPLSVREHPVFGPYVEDLTVNVVNSYSDIQKWLQLGNKQRATAATGMNDKSSRSHSVFTLVMTQTKTNMVEGEEQEHRVVSRINLVDLAGSERCSKTQASEDRLKEGMSINKSLLTLGKVISALSEQSQTRRKVFIPYRESILTWLLKESLGGNSKTAMIATIGPSASNIEETLSTLRYAKQACFIINIAKVNEDMNAKLILDLKAEIEKLKSAQKNVDPEQQKRYRQEITFLRVKLHWQEKEMTEMRRAWKEKLVQAEKKKFEETKELQKAGITFKVDNSLPNLVNLNEDPQLSEMLLYMIKEGQTTVGKCKPNSDHDIQLSGALIAADHCVIKHVDDAVSIIPLGEAMTYVNGKCISNPTLLHHGDRIILGGDHYFRFNHPIEVQKIKKLPRGAALPDDGPKGFEFAKNELLAAQRAQLESEMEAARLKAKEEMMQGIQIAKEMAQQELASQQLIFESHIKSLEEQLEEESRRKQLQEMNNQMATNKIQELEKENRGLELEVRFNKRRLEMETLAAREALEDHTIRHAKILEALEVEKQKIAQEVQVLQQSRGNGRSKAEPTWNSLKLSMMIKEANTISSKLEKDTVFCRYNTVDGEKGTSGPSVQVQVHNIRLGVTTVWSLAKFECKLAAMRELDEMNNTNKADDIFYDPADEWEPDFSNASIPCFSTRRSRSLRKNKRISGCLAEVKTALHNSYLPGSRKNVGSLSSAPPESFLPGICKDLISSALDVLEQIPEEETLVPHLLALLVTIDSGVIAVINAYEQAEESPENFLTVDKAAQSCSVKITSAFEQLVTLTKHWLNNVWKRDEFIQFDDELREGVKRLGGYLLLLLQGGCSDLSSIVTEAQKKITQTLKQMVKYIARLAVLTGSDLSFAAENKVDASNLKQFVPDMCDGIGSGLEHILDGIQKTSEQMQNGLLKWYPQNEVQNQIKDKALALANFLDVIITGCKKKEAKALLTEELFDQELKKASSKSVQLLELHHCLDQVYQIVTSSLEGSYRTRNPLRYFLENICILAGNFKASCELPSTSSIASAENPIHKTTEPPIIRSDLESIARSLIISFEIEHGQNSLKPWDTCTQSIGSEKNQMHLGIDETSTTGKQNGVPKWKYGFWSLSESFGESSPSRILWV